MRGSRDIDVKIAGFVAVQVAIGKGLGFASGISPGDFIGPDVTDAILFDAFGMTVSRTGSTATPFGFVGAGQYQTDADSGLQLLGYRMYDPSVGRFISSDPAKAGDNWSAYCDNNPLGASDPNGLDSITVNGEPYDRHIGDVDDQKGWPHWDGPGGWIGNDGFLRRRNGEVKELPEKVKREIGKAVTRAIKGGLRDKLLRPRDSRRPPFVSPKSAEPAPREFKAIVMGEPYLEPPPGQSVNISKGFITIIGVAIIANPELWPIIPIVAPQLK